MDFDAKAALQIMKHAVGDKSSLTSTTKKTAGYSTPSCTE